LVDPPADGDAQHHGRDDEDREKAIHEGPDDLV
jgi:hypothetical protein